MADVLGLALPAAGVIRVGVALATAAAVSTADTGSWTISSLPTRTAESIVMPETAWALTMRWAPADALGIAEALPAAQ